MTEIRVGIFAVPMLAPPTFSSSHEFLGRAPSPVAAPSAVDVDRMPARCRPTRIYLWSDSFDGGPLCQRRSNLS
jgi:hypothetical protein